MIYHGLLIGGGHFKNYILVLCAPLIQEVRSRAIPPNNWDDIPHDKIAFFPYELVDRFVKEGKNTEWIVRKIHHRVGGFKRAEEMVRRSLKRKQIIEYRMV